MLEFKNVYKSYEKDIISDLSFKLNNKESLGIIGDSGIGKTTIFNLILNIIKPDSGEIINSFENISTVFQEDRLIEEISVLENLKLVSNLEDDYFKQILVKLGIIDFSKKVKELSGGMKRRVAIARALSFNGDLLLLDEPIQGLDEENRKSVIETILEYSKDKSIILISHDKRDIEDFRIEKVIRLNFK